MRVDLPPAYVAEQPTLPVLQAHAVRRAGYDSVVTPSDFRQEEFAARYALMSDEELVQLAVRSSELSDIAWDALEEELERRKLEVPEPEAAAPPSMPAKRNLVVLRTFRDVPEALLAKGMLESSGVECFLADENMVRMDWFISNLLGGVKLLVQPLDFSKASLILNDPAALELEGGSESDEV
jgi:hypothetical protein